jgi:hypothetical protein
VPTSRLREVEFVGYGRDWVVTGFLALGDARLTDALNARDDVHLVDAVVVRHDDGSMQPFEEIAVLRDELMLACAGGGRGDPALRHRTRPYAFVVRGGPYAVRGHLHASSRIDPVRDLARRPAMVPLTDASIEYRVGDRLERAAWATLIVNRDELTDVVLTAGDSTSLPEIVGRWRGPRR